MTGCAEPLAEAEAEEDGDRQRDHDIAGNGGELAAADGGDHVDQAFELRLARRPDVAEQAGQRLRGHRRLFGGDRHAEQEDGDEAEAVDQAEQEGLDEERRMQPGGENLEQRHAADQHPGPGRRTPHAAVVAARFANVVLARTRGVLGHPHGQQARQLRHVMAEAVAAVLGEKGGAEKIRPGRHRAAARARRVRGGQDGDQLAQALETLLAARQQVAEMEAGADRQRPLADALQRVVALVGDDQQLTAVVGGERRIVERAAEGIDEIERLGRQRHETRQVIVEAGRGAHQLALDPEAADAVRQQQHRIEDLLLDATPVDIVQFFLGRQQRPQPLRILRRNPFLPAPVVGAVEDDVHAVLQPAFVGRLRQQPVPQNAPPFGEKSGTGQDAAVGEEGNETKAGDEMHAAGAKDRAQFGIRLEAVQNQFIARGRAAVAPVPRANFGDQPAHQIQGLGGRIAKGLERRLQALLGGLRTARQPAGESGEKVLQATNRLSAGLATGVAVVAPAFPAAIGASARRGSSGVASGSEPASS